MKDIQQVLRRKRAQLAQLSKEVQLLEEVDAKLQQVAALLADDDDNGNLLAEAEDEARRPSALAATATAAAASSQPAEVRDSVPRPTVPRWP